MTIYKITKRAGHGKCRPLAHFASLKNARAYLTAVMGLASGGTFPKNDAPDGVVLERFCYPGVTYDLIEVQTED